MPDPIPEHVVLSPARPDEVALFVELLQEASAWLAERGLDQWPLASLDPQVPSFHRAAAEGELFLARIGEELMGGFVLKRMPPNDLAPDGATASYLSKLVIRRAFAGRSLGALLLSQAELIARNSGCSLVRLDVEEKNQRLCAYYEQHGYGETGAVLAHGSWVRCYEKRV